MITMSVESLDEMEQICRSRRNYRACIYCESSARALAIQEALLTSWHGTSFDRYFGGGLAVRFCETNSVVRIMEPQDLRDTQLYTCHLAMIDYNAYITEELARMLDGLTIPYDLPPLPQRVEWDDEFDYTIYFENGSRITAIHKVPDLGEITPSTEILEFIGGYSG